MNADEMKARAESLRKEAEGIREAAKLCADLDEATEERERALETEAEAERLDRLAEAYESAQIEFAWSVKTQRLCAYAVRKNLGNASDEEAERTTKADAAEYIKTAREHCEKWLNEKTLSGDMAEEEANAAREAIAEISAKAKKDAEALPG